MLNCVEKVHLGPTITSTLGRSSNTKSQVIGFLKKMFNNIWNSHVTL